MKQRFLTKKQIREKFRIAVFTRDGYRCVECGGEAKDAHHITNRNDMPYGGYVKENGVSLCHSCHLDAELGRLSAEYLYAKIGSSHERAVLCSSNTQG